LEGIQLLGQKQQAFRDKKVIQNLAGKIYEKETKAEGNRQTDRKKE
jgi:hypothetical protein